MASRSNDFSTRPQGWRRSSSTNRVEGAEGSDDFAVCRNSLAQCLPARLPRGTLAAACHQKGPHWQSEAVACRRGAKWALFHSQTRPSGSWRLRGGSMSPDTLLLITLILILLAPLAAQLPLGLPGPPPRAASFWLPAPCP